MRHTIEITERPFLWDEREKQPLYMVRCSCGRWVSIGAGEVNLRRHQAIEPDERLDMGVVAVGRLEAAWERLTHFLVS